MIDSPIGAAIVGIGFLVFLLVLLPLAIRSHLRHSQRPPR